MFRTGTRPTMSTSSNHPTSVGPSPVTSVPVPTDPVGDLSSSSSFLSTVRSDNETHAQYDLGRGVSSSSYTSSWPTALASHGPSSRPRQTNPPLQIGQEGYYRKQDLMALFSIWHAQYGHEKLRPQPLKEESEVQQKTKDARDGHGYEDSSGFRKDAGSIKEGVKYVNRVLEQDAGKNADPKKQRMEKAEWQPRTTEKKDGSDFMEDAGQDDDREDLDDESGDSGEDEEGLESRREADKGGVDSSGNNNRGRVGRDQRADDPSQSDSSQQDSASGSAEGAASQAGSSTAGSNPRRIRIRESKNHECEVCGKRFSRPSQLNTHSFTHSGEKPHQCPMCQKYFNVASNLKRHIRTHTNTKRKSSRSGSMVFRSFSNGFYFRQSNGSTGPSGSNSEKKSAQAKATSTDGMMAARRQASAGPQSSDQLRWMNTETPLTGATATGHQKALLRRNRGQEPRPFQPLPSSSSESRLSTQRPQPSKTAKSAPAIMSFARSTIAAATTMPTTTTTATTSTGRDMFAALSITTSSSATTNVSAAGAAAPRAQ
ncbi:hypothetical protein BGZ54_005872, partial [Gamsiella multidivaricata]